MANERDHRLKGTERTTAPILIDVTEEAMLDLVPLAGAGREVRDVDPETQVVGQPLQLLLPRARAIAERMQSRWPTVVELTRHSWAVNAAANFARLLHVHRNGDIGSPRVSGSTNRSKASVTPGWVCSMSGRPAPGRRIRPVASTPRSTPVPNRLAGQPRRRRHQRVTAIADGDRFGRRPQATRPLIEQRRHDDKLRNDGAFHVCVAFHRTGVSTLLCTLAS
jgi:hypothetical protein